MESVDPMNASNRYDSLIQYYAEENGVEWTLLKAQIRAESNFDPSACSRVGAKGLTQFMDSTWQQWGKGIPYNPEHSIDAQARYMAWLLKQQPEIEWALAAYNWGIGRVKKLRASKRGTFYELTSEMPDETVDYVCKILQFKAEYAGG